MTLLLGLTLVLLKPGVDVTKVLAKYRKRLMLPLLVAPWLATLCVIEVETAAC
jgi:hypothetical protein